MATPPPAMPGTVWRKVVPFFGAPPQWQQVGNFAMGVPGQKGDPGPPGQTVMGGGGGGGGSGTVATSDVAFALRGRPAGRLTLSNSVAVTRIDVVAAGTLNYLHLGQSLPGGSSVSLFNGSVWQSFTLSGAVSLALTVTSGKNYDVFLYSNSGTLTLVLSAAWTNDSTRADAFAVQDGVIVNSVAYGPCAIKTGLWVGTIRASGANVCEDSVAHRFVCNAYNKFPRMLRAMPGYVDDNAYTSYTTSSTTWVEANGGTGSKADFISDGLNPFWATMTSFNQLSNAGLGIDSITTPTIATDVETGKASASMTWSDILSEGYHFLDLLIVASDGGTATYYADASRFGGSFDSHLTGFTATIYG